MNSAFSFPMAVVSYTVFMAETMIYVGLAVVGFLAVALLFAGGLVTFLIFLPLASIAAVIAVMVYFPLAVVVTVLPWTVGHAIGHALSFLPGARDGFAGLLAGTAWWAVSSDDIQRIPFLHERGLDTPIGLTQNWGMFSDLVSDTSWMAPIVGTVVAFRMYSNHV